MSKPKDKTGNPAETLADADPAQALMQALFSAIGQPTPGPLDTTGIGPNAAWQSLIRDLNAALGEYNQAVGEYQEQMLEITRDAGIKLKQDFDSESAGGPREIYNRWIEECEAVYGDRAFTPEFGRIFARVINAMAKVRLCQRSVMDRWLSTAGMPDSAAMDSVFRKLGESQQRAQAASRRLEDLEQRIGKLEAKPRRRKASQ